MSFFSSPQFLRRVLLADALASGAAGLLMIAMTGLLQTLLSIPAGLLLAAGLVLVPYVAFVVFTATRPMLNRSAVWAIVVANMLWTAASVLLLLSGWIAPSPLGFAFVIAQAAAVFLLGELQMMGLKRSPIATA